jgi:hypothetical protein
MSAHNCIHLVTANYCLSCSTSQWAVWNFYCTESGGFPHLTTPKFTFTAPTPCCHIALNFNHTFHVNCGPMIMTTIQLSNISTTPNICATAASSVMTSPITSFSVFPRHVCLSPSLFILHSNLLLCHGCRQVPVPLVHDMMRINSCKHFNTCLFKLIKKINIRIKIYKWDTGSTWGWILFFYLLIFIYN